MIAWDVEDVWTVFSAALFALYAMSAVVDKLR
jgi:hypothetical protein